MTDRRDERLKDLVCAIVELAVAVYLLVRMCEDVCKMPRVAEN